MRVDTVSFYRPGFKVVMAKKEIRQDNGDLEFPPHVYRRINDVWERIPFKDAPEWVARLVHKRRLSHDPVFRNLVGTLLIDCA